MTDRIRRSDSASSTSTAPTSGAHPTIALGSGGAAVSEAQELLAKLGLYKEPVDGIFGPLTRAAVLALQRRHFLARDGVIGPETWKVLLEGPGAAKQVAKARQTDSVVLAPVSKQLLKTPAAGGLELKPPARVDRSPELGVGARGKDVDRLQRLLKAAGYPIKPDGIFGEATQAALARFQLEYELPDSGVATRRTWEALRDAVAGVGVAKVLRIGARGAEVEAVQRQLCAAGYPVKIDGRFGGDMQTAVLAFQQARGLPQSGLVTASTWAALESLPAPGPEDAGAMRLGATGAEVSRLQQRLIKLGYPQIADGTFGVQTHAALVRLQREKGLPETGAADAATLTAVDQELATPLHPEWMSYRPGALYAPNAPDTVELFRAAARRAGLPESWASAPGLHNILGSESDGYVGVPNYTYRAKLRSDIAGWQRVHDQLKDGRVTALSSATGLGQLLSRNARHYYPSGLDGIGVPLEEAVGMLRYIEARYGNPDKAWRRYQAGRGY